MHACPPSTETARAPRGKGPRTRAQAKALRAKRDLAAHLDTIPTPRRERVVADEVAPILGALAGLTYRRGKPRHTA